MSTCEFCEINAPCYECFKESIERVRELHESTVESMQVWEKAENGIWYLGYRNFNVCRTCRITQNIQGIVYPCATIQALDGEL